MEDEDSLACETVSRGEIFESCSLCGDVMIGVLSAVENILE